MPFCTIGKGASVVTAGQTVRVLAGTYAETVNGRTPAPPGNPITVSAAPGVTVTGLAGNSTNGGAFRITSKSYIVVDGFTITGTADYGIILDTSNHITISNNHVSYSGTASIHKVGIYLRATTDSIVTGNTTDHNTMDGIRLNTGSNYNTVSNNVSFGNAEGTVRNACGIDVLASNYNTIIHNVVYANEDTGLNFYTGSSYNLVLGNLTYGNGDHGIDNNAAPNQVIVGNTVQGNVTVGINIEGATSPGSGGATVANNVLVDNGLLRLVGGGTSSAGSAGNIRVDAQSQVGTTLDYNLYYLTAANGGTVQVVWQGFSSFTSLAAFKAAVPGQETHGLQANPLLTAPAVPGERPPAAPFNVAVHVGDYHLTAGLAGDRQRELRRPERTDARYRRVTRASTIPRPRTRAPARGPMTTAAPTSSSRKRPNQPDESRSTRSGPTTLVNRLDPGRGKRPRVRDAQGLAIARSGRGRGRTIPSNPTSTTTESAVRRGGRSAAQGRVPASAPRGALDGARGSMRATHPTVRTDEQVR